MLLKRENKDNRQVVLTIQVEQDVWEKALEEAYEQSKALFKKEDGSLPTRQEMEEKHGADVFYQDAVNSTFPIALVEAVRQEDISVAGAPELSVEAIGPEAMYAKLQAVDPEAAAAIHPNNKVRVLRALEHYHATGKRLSEQKADSLPPERPYRSLVLGLDFPDRAALYRRIDLRVDKMLEAGLLAEAEYVWRNREAFRTAAQAIGYKEFFPYFEQTAALDACTEKLKQASRNYAKRQLTWFRHMDGVTWLDAGAADVRQTALRLTQDFLSKG